ncbi:hypothetical protein BASA83_006726 [Batrachochytrium salamandrivorans]|nr:hypothetical protein BASA83_006726 [Batrachochytrium salamandrivorans]
MDQRYSNATATELATWIVCALYVERKWSLFLEMLHWLKLFVLLLVLAVGCWLLQSVSLNRINPNTPKRLLVANVFISAVYVAGLERQQACPTCRQSVMDIPAQAPVQPAIVNPVAAVNPIATNGNDNMPQPAGAVHPHQYPQALPAANASLVVITLSHRTSPVYGVPGYLDQF